MADQGLDGAARNPGVGSLRAALHKARIEAADRTGVVVDLRDAEAARLEILNEALDQLFTEIPPGVDLFDRGLSQGDTPRLWIDSLGGVAAESALAASDCPRAGIFLRDRNQLIRRRLLMTAA